MASGDQNSDLRRTPRVLGSLESRIMEQLWATNAPCSVQDVVDALGGGHNYKTVMTVLNRLVTKQLLTRELDGRAYRYRAPNSRTDFMRSVADEIVRSYEGAYGSEGMPHLVRAIGASAPSPQPTPRSSLALDDAEAKGPPPVAILLSAVVLLELLRILLARRTG